LTTLNRQFTRETQRLLAGFSVAISAVVLCGLILGSWIGTRNDIETLTEILANRILTDLDGIDRELQSLASSPILATGLAEKRLRPTYLAPLLAELNRSQVRRYALFDQYGGAVLNDQNSPKIDPSHLRRVLVTRKTARIGTHRTGEEPSLTILVPIQNSAGAVLGLIACAYAPLRALATGSIRLGSQDRVAIIIQDRDPASGFLTPQDWSPWRFVQRIELRRRLQTIQDGNGRPIELRVDRPLTPLYVAVLFGLGVLLIFLSALRQRIQTWAQRTGKRLTERLDRLSEVCQRIATGERLLPHPDPLGDEIGILNRVLRDAIQAQWQLAERLEPAAMVLRNVQEGVVMTDEAGCITEVNPAFQRMTAWQDGELLGRPGGILYRSMENPQQAAEIAEAVRTEGQWRGETRILCANGNALPVLLSIAAVRDATGTRRGNVALIADMSEARRVSDRLRKMAMTDAMTGLPNHVGFEQQLQAALDQAGTQRLALAFIDLDRLKFINDLFGHQVGDQAICAVAKHLRSTLPHCAVVSRRSGDEFLLFVPFEGSEAQVRQQIAQLVDDLEMFDGSLPGGRLTLSLSVGAALFPDHANTTAELMMAADSALQQAKLRGRGRVAWYDSEIGQQMLARVRLESRLREALSQHQIKVAYQPEIDLTTGQIIGFEALTRWNDALLGEVSPTEFIPVAEDAHLIDAVFDAVLKIVLVDLRAIAERFPGVRVAINVSPKQLRDDRLVRLLIESKKHLPQLGELLELEITETHLAREESSVSGPLRSIAALGLRVAVDDFGKGYSSLARLTSLPITRLKIDRLFVAGLAQAPQVAIVRAILGLAEATGLEVTAEGIEHPEQLQILRQLGCRRGQGWLFSRALPLADALDLPKRLRGAAATLPSPRAHQALSTTC